MGKLLYSTIMSLDGYVADEQGEFGWAEPDVQVHRFINEQDRRIGTYLYGRLTYETMKVWETDPTLAEGSALLAEFARQWQQAEKVVYSTTLRTPPTRRTRIESGFDPESVRELVRNAESDVELAGPALVGQAFRAGLIDECCLYVVPIIVGGGKSALPSDVRVSLELREQRRFDSGFVYLRYTTRG